MDIDKALQENGLIGVIYSKSDAGEYTIQIFENGKHVSLEGSPNDKKRFASLHAAKLALKSHGVNKAYMALDNVYDEFGHLDFEDHQSSNKSRHDYMPISLD